MMIRIGVQDTLLFSLFFLIIPHHTIQGRKGVMKWKSAFIASSIFGQDRNAFHHQGRWRLMIDSAALGAAASTTKTSAALPPSMFDLPKDQTLFVLDGTAM